MDKLKLIGLQYDIIWEDPVANRKKIDQLLAKRSEAVDIIVLPEMFCTGFTMNPQRFGEQIEGNTYHWMEKLAQDKNALVMGSTIIRENGHFFNRFLAVSPDGLIGEYDKRHLFRLSNEDMHYKPGKEWVVLEYKGWHICPQVCYDLRFPVWSRNRVWDDEKPSYDLLVYVANWPEARIHHWDALLKARAIENQVYTVGINRVGRDGNNLNYTGSSVILNPLGDLIESAGSGENLIQAELDPEMLHHVRNKFPFWQDADEFDLAL